MMHFRHRIGAFGASKNNDTTHLLIQNLMSTPATQTPQQPSSFWYSCAGPYRQLFPSLRASKHQKISFYSFAQRMRQDCSWVYFEKTFYRPFFWALKDSMLSEQTTPALLFYTPIFWDLLFFCYQHNPSLYEYLIVQVLDYDQIRIYDQPVANTQNPFHHDIVPVDFHEGHLMLCAQQITKGAILPPFSFSFDQSSGFVMQQTFLTFFNDVLQRYQEHFGALPLRTIDIQRILVLLPINYQPSELLATLCSYTSNDKKTMAQTLIASCGPIKHQLYSQYLYRLGIFHAPQFEAFEEKQKTLLSYLQSQHLADLLHNHIKIQSTQNIKKIDRVGTETKRL